MPGRLGSGEDGHCDVFILNFKAEYANGAGGTPPRQPAGRRRYSLAGYVFRLLRCDQRVGDGVDRERDAVLNTDFTHQLGDVRLHGALLDAEG